MGRGEARARRRRGHAGALRRLLVASLAAAWLATIATPRPAPAAAQSAATEPTRVLSARVESPDRLRLRLSAPLGRLEPGNFRFAEADAPDIAIPVREVRGEPGNRITLRLARKLDPAGSYRLEIREPPLARAVRPPRWGLFLTVILSSALINNFVFTRYLGLCIFFGVSKRRDTSLGMGATFTFVMIVTGMVSWLLYRFVMRPLELRFLQVLVFIGVVAILVQFLDTMLRKTHRALHERFGIYLVLITTNCIILAVPLLNAAADTGALESFALAMGSGAGFALALFLMSCARERLELARVPASMQGLPVAFALAGLFALAFMGFSGLDFLR